ncbi:MAG: glycosyltransferase family A protein [Blastocatellia bacterium]
MQLKISVIIPVFNGEKYIKEAINSVLEQTFQDFEIIVIDDGSTDKTEEIVKSFPTSKIHYEKQVNKGVAAARNGGVELAKNDWIAFLDADDLWVKNKLELQINAFLNNQTLDIILGQVEHFYSPELSLEKQTKLYCPKEIQPGFLPSTMLVKKEVFDRVGLFETKWKIGEFIDWYDRSRQQCISYMLNVVLLKRRVHNASLTVTNKAAQRDYLQILKSSLDRRKNLD